MNDKSCVGCKYLYSQDIGYSDYTVLDTEIRCAKGNNPNLPESLVIDWAQEEDNWDKTNTSRCGLYSPGEMVELDVDGYLRPEDQTQDEEAIAAINEHSGR